MQKKVNTAAAASEQNQQSVGGKRNGGVGLKRSGANKTDTTICRWQQDYGITREVLDQLLDQRRDDAAKTLGVCTSTLKRACRKLGISRWGKRPNSSLYQKQVAVKKHKGTQPRSPAPAPALALALPPAELEATTPTIIVQGNSTMSAKVTYKEHTIRFPLPFSSTMLWLEEELENKFKISIQNFYIKYKDEEDEWITLMCDSGLMHGMDVLRSSGQTIIRMKVDPKSQNLPSPPQQAQAQAQPPPNTESNCDLGPTGSGKGVSQILERPNGLGTTANTAAAASAALMKLKMREGDISFVGHPQPPQIGGDDDHCANTVEGCWLNMHNLQGGMMVFPPRMNSSLPSGDSSPALPNNQTLGTSLAFEPGSLGGMVQQNWGSRHPQTNGHHSVNQMPIDMMPASSPRMMMNYSLPSDDSLGSFDPDCLLLDNEESGAVVIESRNREEEARGRIQLSINVSFLLRPEFQFQNMAVKLPNKKELLGPTRKPAQDFRLPTLIEIRTLSSLQFLELYRECRLFKIKYPECSALELLVFWNILRNKELPDIVERVLLYVGKMNHTIGISLSLLAVAHEPQSNRGRMHTLLVCIKRMFMDFLEGLYLVHLDCRERLLDRMDRVFLEMVMELLVVDSTLEIKNHRVGISLEAECRGGMIQQQQQQNSSSEGQIPESSCAAIIGETNVVVGLNRSTAAKGNSSSSSKTKDAISRWQKDNGITREVLELLFDKSRGDDSKIRMLGHIHSREHVESLALALALDPQISREKAPIPHSAKKNMYKLLRSIREVNHVLLCHLKNSKVISPCP